MFSLRKLRSKINS